MITTDRLLLRPYKPSDWERVHLYASVPKFSQFEVWGPNSVDETKEFVTRCIAEFSEVPLTSHQLAIELLESGLLIGGCTLKSPVPESTEAFLGYAINPDFQNRGFATEAAKALIQFGFDRLKLSLIYATCDTRNTASWRVMEKAGLQRTSTIHGDRQRKGSLTDSYRYEIRRDL